MHTYIHPLLPHDTEQFTLRCYMLLCSAVDIFHLINSLVCLFLPFVFSLPPHSVCPIMHLCLWCPLWSLNKNGFSSSNSLLFSSLFHAIMLGILLCHVSTFILFFKGPLFYPQVWVWSAMIKICPSLCLSDITSGSVHLDVWWIDQSTSITSVL